MGEYIDMQPEIGISKHHGGAAHRLRVAGRGRFGR